MYNDDSKIIPLWAQSQTCYNSWKHEIQVHECNQYMIMNVCWWSRCTSNIKLVIYCYNFMHLFDYDISLRHHYTTVLVMQCIDTSFRCTRAWNSSSSISNSLWGVNVKTWTFLAFFLSVRSFRVCCDCGKGNKNKNQYTNIITIHRKHTLSPRKCVFLGWLTCTHRQR